MGSAILLWGALLDRSYGFLLLEGLYTGAACGAAELLADAARKGEIVSRRLLTVIFAGF